MFFFFKQKTAYEMRISDWSSDVCSSDLCFADEASQREAPHRGAPRRAGRRRGVRRDGARADREIGRASCRERVCQYGVDLGGRRSIKTKRIVQIILHTTTNMTPRMNTVFLVKI